MPERSEQTTRPEARSSVLTVTEAAREAGKSRMTILRQLASGELRGRKVGGRWLIDGASLAQHS